MSGNAATAFGALNSNSAIPNEDVAGYGIRACSERMVSKYSHALMGNRANIPGTWQDLALGRASGGMISVYSRALVGNPASSSPPKGKSCQGSGDLARFRLRARVNGGFSLRK